MFKDKNLQYVFRPQVHSDQFGEASCSFLAENAKAKLEQGRRRTSRSRSSTRTAPTASASPWATRRKCKKLGMQIVLKEGYAATAPDLSSLVTKLRRAQPDVILHTGYNPDITLFLRQSQGSRA